MLHRASNLDGYFGMILLTDLLTYLLNYFLTSWYRILLEKLIIIQLFKK
jgi:hypothetical protein